MSTAAVNSAFDFDLVQRNEYLADQQKFQPLTFKKTGTTIGACIYKDGIVLGADTRATAGTIVADKNCEKLHRLSSNIYCGGAGTAADLQMVSGMIESQLELHAFNVKKLPRVVTAMTQAKEHLFKYQGYVGAYLLIGGVDATGAHLFSVHAAGSVDKVPYKTDGSGSLVAMSILENEYRDNLSEEEAIDLMSRSIASGVMHDLGSGSNVDIMVITKADPAHPKMLRNYKTVADLQPNFHAYKRQFQPKVANITKSDILRSEGKLTLDDVQFIDNEEVQGGAGTMDVDK